MISSENNRWLKNGFAVLAFASLFSCSHASQKSPITGASKLISESCPKNLGIETNKSSSAVNVTIVVDIQVDKQGKASSVAIIQSSNDEKVDAAVIKFYEQCAYTIAKINGRTVTGTTTQGYTHYL